MGDIELAGYVCEVLQRSRVIPLSLRICTGINDDDSFASRSQLEQWFTETGQPALHGILQERPNCDTLDDYKRAVKAIEALSSLISFCRTSVRNLPLQLARYFSLNIASTLIQIHAATDVFQRELGDDSIPADKMNEGADVEVEVLRGIHEILTGTLADLLEILASPCVNTVKEKDIKVTCQPITSRLQALLSQPTVYGNASTLAILTAFKNILSRGDAGWRGGVRNVLPEIAKHCYNICVAPAGLDSETVKLARVVLCLISWTSIKIHLAPVDLPVDGRSFGVSEDASASESSPSGTSITVYSWATASLITKLEDANFDDQITTSCLETLTLMLQCGHQRDDSSSLGQFKFMQGVSITAVPAARLLACAHRIIRHIRSSISATEEQSSVQTEQTETAKDNTFLPSLLKATIRTLTAFVTSVATRSQALLYATALASALRELLIEPTDNITQLLFVLTHAGSEVVALIDSIRTRCRSVLLLSERDSGDSSVAVLLGYTSALSVPTVFASALCRRLYAFLKTYHEAMFPSVNGNWIEHANTRSVGYTFAILRALADVYSSSNNSQEGQELCWWLFRGLEGVLFLRGMTLSGEGLMQKAATKEVAGLAASFDMLTDILLEDNNYGLNTLLTLVAKHVKFDIYTSGTTLTRTLLAPPDSSLARSTAVLLKLWKSVTQSDIYTSLFTVETMDLVHRLNQGAAERFGCWDATKVVPFPTPQSAANIQKLFGSAKFERLPPEANMLTNMLVHGEESDEHADAEGSKKRAMRDAYGNLSDRYEGLVDEYNDQEVIGSFNDVNADMRRAFRTRPKQRDSLLSNDGDCSMNESEFDSSSGQDGPYSHDSSAEEERDGDLYGDDPMMAFGRESQMIPQKSGAVDVNEIISDDDEPMSNTEDGPLSATLQREYADLTTGQSEEATIEPEINDVCPTSIVPESEVSKQTSEESTNSEENQNALSSQGSGHEADSEQAEPVDQTSGDYTETGDGLPDTNGVDMDTGAALQEARDDDASDEDEDAYVEEDFVGDDLEKLVDGAGNESSEIDSDLDLGAVNDS